MGRSGVLFNGNFLMDISDTTATEETVLENYVFYGADGNRYVGTASSGGDYDLTRFVSVNNQAQIPEVGSAYKAISRREDASTFNDSLVIGDNVANCSYMLSGCSNFNQNVTIPNIVCNISGMFENCSNFNQNITIPNNVTNCEALFKGCSNFEQDINIPDNVNSYKELFSGCTNFNLNFEIKEKVTDISYLFNGCSNFDQNITIPEGVINCSYLFNGCVNLNQSILIPNGVTDCAYIFGHCINFNQNYYNNSHIWFPKSVTNLCGAFKGCNNIRQLSINIDNYGTTNENLHNNIKDVSHMFEDCTNLYATFPGIRLGNSQVINTSFMFSNCINIGSSVYAHINVSFNTSYIINSAYMYYNCTNLYSGGITTSILGSYDTLNTSGAFRNCINISCNGGDWCNLSSFYNLIDCSNMFRGCIKLYNNWNSSSYSTSYNGVKLPINIINTSNMFIDADLYNCTSFTINGYLNNLLDCSYMFANARKAFPTVINNANKLINTTHMCEGCYSGSISDQLKLPDSVVDASYMFNDFRGSISTSNGCGFITGETSELINASCMFANSYFNGYGSSSNNNWYLPTKLVNCYRMFYNCYYFSGRNLNIYISDNVIDAREMFYNCNLWNTSIIISENSKINNMHKMFYNCNYLRSVTNIPNGVTDCSYMAFNCNQGFNYPINIPNSVTNCSYMFAYCRSYNQNVIVPENVEDCSYMIHNCYNLMSKNIYIKRSVKPFNCVKMIGNYRNTRQRINIFCSSDEIIELLKATTAEESITGQAMTWTNYVGGNCNCANTAFNIYIYNNMPEGI